MQKISVAEARRAEAIGREVVLQGWIRTRRDSKAGLSFLEVNDGSSLGNIQVIAESSLANYESEVKRLSPGSSVAVRGVVRASPGKGQATEVPAIICRPDLLAWAGRGRLLGRAFGPDGKQTVEHRADLESSLGAFAALPDGRILVGGFAIECRDPLAAGVLWRYQDAFTGDLRVRGSLLLAWNWFPCHLRVYELPPAGAPPPRDEGRPERGAVPTDLAGQLAHRAN